MKDLTEGKLLDELIFAKNLNDFSLLTCIETLKKVDININSETTITNDFAPRSFYFNRIDKDGHFIGNGGIIFHDVKNGVGTNSAPSFSVSIENNPKPHWQIHT